MFFIVLGQHVSILIESSSGPSKKIDPYLEILKCAVGSQTLTFLIKLCIKFMCRCFLNVQPEYLFLKLGSSVLIETHGFSLTSYKFNVLEIDIRIVY